MTSKDIFVEGEFRDSASVQFALKPVFLAIGITVSAVLPVFLTGALAVQIRRDLELTPSRLGAAVATFFAFAALFSFLSGRYAHRIDRGKILKVGLVCSSVILAGIAVFATTYPVFVGFLALSGIVNGSIQPPVNIFLSHVIPKGRQGFAFGVKQAAVPVSTLLAGLAVPTIALTIGWRYAFLAAAPFGVILLLIVSGTSLSLDTKDGPGLTSDRPPLAPIVVLGIAMGLGTGAANAFGAFFVSYVVRSGWSPGAAGILAVVGSILGVLARVGNGILADKRRGRHFLVAAWSAGIGGIGYLFFVVGLRWLIVPATVISYVAGWGWNGLFIFAVVRNFTRFAGYATGTVQSGAYIGSVLGPLAFGFIVESAGYSVAWTFAAASAFGAALSIALARKMIMSSQSQAVG